MPPQKTQTAPVITDGDRLAVLEGLVRHVIEELHDQNKTAAEQYENMLNPMYGQLSQVRADVRALAEVVEEARPLLESPVAKFMAQRRERRVLTGRRMTPEQKAALIATAEQELRNQAPSSG